MFKLKKYFRVNKKQRGELGLIFSAIALLIMVAFAVFSFSSNKLGDKLVVAPETPKIIGRAVLTIDFGNGTKRAFEGDVVENETLLDALTLTSKAGNFRYELDKKMNLAAIETFTATNGKKWQLRINDKKIDKPLSEVILKDGDNILIKYTK